MPKNDPYRLPRHTVPHRYDVELSPDLAAATFSGRVTIAVTTHDAADSIVLNAADLAIQRCLVDGEEVATSLDAQLERLTLDIAPSPGDHTITIDVTGTLNDQLRGWYRSTFRNAEGDEQVIATSQMQSTDCRRAFPCWDEPDFKAVFGVTLVVEPELLAISNGREVDRTVGDDGKVTVRFADTMPMSSYLVAFVVGPLEVTDPVDVGSTPLRVVHVPGKGDLTEFGIEVATFSLKWFEDYYGIEYPSDKVDLVGLPDFAAGAMENLGCITFRENLLLANPDDATQSELQLVADVVSHELAHMWFGDLVTMRWWNGIWLNEAFATFMEVAACDAFRPAWDRWTAFGLERSAAFEVDALSSTRSVEFKVEAPAEAEGMFDVLTYEKGGALLRMLEQHLGADVFRDGIRRYLDQHRFGNTETSDLWDAIEAVSGAPVREIMDSWIWQPGFPLVSARLSGDELVLTQRRFSYDDAADDTIWQIPVGVRVGDTVHRMVLGSEPIRLSVGDEPVIVNEGGHGFFRVDYDAELRSRLTTEAISSAATLERYCLVDDAWAAVIAGSLDPMEYLALVEQYGGERHPGVWRSIAKGLRGVRRLVRDDESATAGLAERIWALTSPIVAELGDPVDGEDETTAQLRGLVLELAAIEGRDETAAEWGREIYDRWSDGEELDADLVAAATRVVAATGTDADYDRFVEQYQAGSTPQVKLRHLNALADFPDRDQIERTIEYAFSDDVKTQNAPYLLAKTMANVVWGELAWEAVRRRWAEVNERFPRSSIHRCIEPVIFLDRPEQVADVQGFFAEHPIEQATQQVAQTLERQRVHAALRSRAADTTAEALTTN